jgi:hypothetical protein
MKRYTTDELEELLKERSDQYLLYPSDRVWSNIKKELHPNRNWVYASLFLLIFAGITTGVMLIHQKKSSLLSAQPFTAYQFMEERPSEKMISPIPSSTFIESSNRKNVLVYQPAKRPIDIQPVSNDSQIEEESKKELIVPFHNNINAIPITLENTITLSDLTKTEKKNSLGLAIGNIIEQARKIGKNAKWQIYATPSLGYRRLSGEASSLTYQYSSYSLSTNALTARDVNDAVSHRPGIGFEVGAAMYYPLGKRLQLKAGLQANYNHYQIDAFESAPEIANYGLNNLSFGRIPISALSSYTTENGYSNATLRNEHYMLSIPLGIDYRVAGNDKLNFSVATTVQPTFVFANYSYLISTNLRNYAKEPSLNRHWNINSALEANLNIDKGGYKWSIGPQFRYQLLSSFKEKYPITENLTDFGIKVGVIKTIK